MARRLMGFLPQADGTLRYEAGILNNTLSRFLLVGGANTVTGLSVIYGGKMWGGMGDVSANLLGYGVGLTLSYVLNSSFTFRCQNKNWITVVRYIIVFLISYLSNLLFVLLFINAGGNSYLAHALGMPIYTFMFYYGSKHFAFREIK